MNSEDLLLLITDITTFASSEFEFGDYEHEPGMHCHHIQQLVKSILTELQNEKYGGKYNLSENDILIISYLAMFHDIGKSKVPGSIVHNPGKLTDEEFEQMKLHTIYGAEIILRYKDIIKNKKILGKLVNICKYHHEKWDGKGYPERLMEDDIPLEAQVTGIADCYEVLVSKRSYKKAIDKNIAIEYIRQGMCGAFNPDILDAFLKVVQNE